MSISLSRRRFLGGSGAACAVSILPRKAEGQTVRIRKDIATLASDGPELTAYRKAIVAMREMSDQRGWQGQAEIHDNFCQHQNWKTLPWHRAYVLNFENLIREFSGDASFALPYWNWTKDPLIPASFWGDDNPLAHARSADANTAMRDEFVGASNMEEILAIEDFEQFASFEVGTGTLEGGPHNHVHGRIGGDMASFLSPRDPIFWLHHSNIDRLWALWNRSHGNTNAPAWLNTRFENQFVSPDGSPVSVGVADVLSTDDLGYQYDDLGPEPDPASAQVAISIDFSAISELTVASDTITEQVPTGAPLSVVLPTNPGLASVATSVSEPSAAAAEPARRRVRVRVAGLQPPAEPDSFVRVFINCPYLDIGTPINDPHFVASIDFFAPSNGSHHSSLTYVFDVTPTLQRLGRARMLTVDEIEPQLIGISGDGTSGGEVEIVNGKISVEVAEAR
ncbi:tyrosinase family protein [Mesorhizobium sp.]|uniref:tyrosinase family protein n=1 Tax=Mesorhizobium sp. TaxID=1871066 RepID=UPI000FE88837|nr:tyrosinase family protein [Mesorhizobium sp.]RWA97860.1 MAG: twin-arginine translocation signal domain-containing protein [Mesorhizobium sp.]